MSLSYLSLFGYLEACGDRMYLLEGLRRNVMFGTGGMGGESILSSVIQLKRKLCPFSPRFIFWTHLPRRSSLGEVKGDLEDQTVCQNCSTSNTAGGNGQNETLWQRQAAAICFPPECIRVLTQSQLINMINFANNQIKLTTQLSEVLICRSVWMVSLG